MKAFMCFQNNWLDLCEKRWLETVSSVLHINSFDNLFAQI